MFTYNNLEQENKQLEEQHDLLIDNFQKEREELCKQIKQENDARKRFVEKVKQLKEQLAEKDKEIEKLKNKLKRTERAMHEEVKEHLEYYNAYQKQLRKKVCDDIEREIENLENIELSTYISLLNIIDKIEEAKE